MHIEAVNFYLCRHAQPDCAVNQFEHNKHCEKHIGVNRDNPQCLNAEKFCPSSVEETLHDAIFTCTEQADRNRAPDSVYHMDRHGADRVIDPGNIIKKFH